MTQKLGMLSSSQDVKIFIGGLHQSTNEQSLAIHFSQYGQIIEAKVIMDKVTGNSKGYGFVRVFENLKTNT